jgi:hypothetical protein
MSDGEQQTHSFQITIDKEHFTVHAPSLTGVELRALPSAPIGADRDLYEEVPGPGEDVLIEDATLVQMRNGLHLFTTPHTITPG